MGIVLETVTDKVRLLSNVKPKEKGPSYTYVETDFIRALKYGYVCEVQEPTVIMQPGVLVGLNSLLEQTGSITLPTGEVIRRHPDAVVIVTTNIAYEGCRGLNQSVTDRMSLAQDIELPSPEVMAQRAMHVTGCDDEILVSRLHAEERHCGWLLRDAQPNRLDIIHTDHRRPVYLGVVHCHFQSHRR